MNTPEERAIHIARLEKEIEMQNAQIKEIKQKQQCFDDTLAKCINDISSILNELWQNLIDDIKKST